MIIVGGGIAGLSVGWRLASRGHPVTILEAGRIGEGASHAAAGYLQPGLEAGSLTALEWASLRAMPALVAGIEAETGFRVDLRMEGLLRIGLPGEEADLVADRDRRRALGWDVALLDGAEARRLEPALAPDVVCAVHLRDVCWVDGRKLCAALAEGIRRRGGLVVEGIGVTALREAGGRVTGVETDRGPREADAVLLAAGWQVDRIAGVPDEVPASVPVRGVILTLGTDARAPILRHIVKHTDAVLCPRGDGRLIVGVTREPGRRDPLPDAGSVHRILGHACRAVPACADLPFLEAVCRFRPYLAGDAPLIGPSRRLAGLHYALGYGADGYLRCAAASERIADAILRRNAAGLP